MVPAAAGLLIVLASAATATGVAQTPTPPPAKPHQHQEGMHGMQGMQGMQGMMGGPHHVLAMAYRDNLVTFARALQAQVDKSKSVNLDLARPAVEEMRRSFDQMQQHHQAMMAQMTMMGDSMKAAMTGMKQHMATRLSALTEHLTALESEVRSSVPDPGKVSEHAAEIVKALTEMPAMPGK